MLTDYVSKAARAVAGLVYPPQCVGCGLDIDGRECMLCSACLEEMNLISGGGCRRCGYPVGAHTRPESCPQCEDRELSFTAAAAACRYGGLARELILQFKYGRRMIVGRTLAALMAERARRRGLRDEADVITAVPLHEKKRTLRGFNQAEVLAERVAAHLQRPYRKHLLARVTDTRAQTELDRVSRMANVKGAFAVRGNAGVRGLRVLLIDDVMTTGSTLSECAAALRRAGAARVNVLVAARD